jgi:gamma-glutamylcyclotransferase (GGCT)/AIG2-like uncharacterized protein YtfP
VAPDPDDPACRLVAYGTLIPGRSNHHMMAGLDGTWSEIRVHGTLGESEWNGLEGLPAFVPDPAAPPVDAWLFTSTDLPRHWPALDDFEGPGYRRVIVDIETPTGAWLPPAQVYEALHMRPARGPLRH